MGVQAQDKEHEVKELLDCDVQDLKDHFHEFIDLGIRITDWEVEGEGGEAGANDDMGVAVDFDDDDENDAQNGVQPPTFLSQFACTLFMDDTIQHVATARCMGAYALL